MTPSALADLVRSVAHDVLTDRGIDAALLPEQVTVRRPGRPDHGDYSSNVALLVAARAEREPLELAGWLADALSGADGIGEVAVASPGFLNVRLVPGASACTLHEVLDRVATCGSRSQGDGRVVAVEVADTVPDSLERLRLEAHRTAVVGLLRTTGARVDGQGGRRFVLTPGPVDLFRDRAPMPGASAVDLLDAIGDNARYALLRAPLTGALTIDLDIWGQRTVANPAFRVQYAHARLVSIAAGARDLGIVTDGADPALLIDERERNLTAELADTGRVLDEAALRGEPHRMVRHVERIAGAFFAMHDGLDVLPRGDAAADEVLAARLLLCDVTRQLLATAAGILGLSTPERL